MNMAVDKFKDSSRRINTLNKLEDDANTKSAVLTTAKKVLPELALQHKLDGHVVSALEIAMEESLIASEKTRAVELWIVATEALRDMLKALHIERPNIQEDFFTMLESEMEKV